MSLSPNKSYIYTFLCVIIKQQLSTMLLPVYKVDTWLKRNIPYRGALVSHGTGALMHLPHHPNALTLCGRDKMGDISQTTFWNVFSSMGIFEFRLQFHWSLFLMVWLTEFSIVSDNGLTSSNQCWLVYRRFYALLGLIVTTVCVQGKCLLMQICTYS